MNEKILVVDDEKEIADLLEVYLKNDNYIVHKYYNGIEALECIQKTEIDLAILDVMLPDIDGFRICQKIRENYYFPVIMLTAKIDDGDKIMGLTIGADDYITKPFNPLEVMRQMYSSLHDILEDTIGGNLDIIGKSDIGDTYNSVLSVLQLGLLVTSFLLLFVSVLGQINIGLSSLEQRTHELLIRRAIGASRANIVTLVLGAQLTISVSVCIVSILISFFLVQGMGLFLPVDSPVAALEYPILSAVVAVITSVVVALLGGLLPALKAAKLEPALALR